MRRKAGSGSLLLAAVLLLVPTVRCAAQYDGPLHIGLVGGLAFSGWRGDAVTSGAGRRTGFQVGAIGALDLSPVFRLSTGLYYSQEGVAGPIGGGATGSIKLDYLRLPVHLEVTPSRWRSSRLQPYFFAGPTLGFLQKCSISVTTAFGAVDSRCEDPFQPVRFRGTDLGVDMGVGVRLQGFSLSARYGLGLRSVDGTGSGADVKNYSFGISAGFSY